MGIPLSAHHIAEQNGHFEPQRANNGWLEIKGLLNAGEGGDLTLSVESFPLPKEHNAVLEVRWMNERRKVAGPANVEDQEITLRDFVDVETLKTLFAWRRACFAAAGINAADVPFIDAADRQTLLDGAMGLSRHVKRSGTYYLVTPDGGHVRTWAVQGMLPIGLDPGNVDMTSEDQIKIGLTLTVDRIRRVEPATIGFTDLSADSRFG
jgi:hypothetical protein